MGLEKSNGKFQSGHKAFLTIPEIPYGELINSLNASNRFVYKGSVTTPPCATFVYWNVFAKVMPIKLKHLKIFKKIIATKSPDILTSAGNYRVTCKIDK